MDNLFKMSEVLEEQPSIFLRISRFFGDSCIFWKTSNASKEFILHFPVEVLGASKSPGEYDVFCELDLEGMAKFILDMHLSMYRERDECHVERGCGSLDPCGCNLALERPDFY